MESKAVYLDEGQREKRRYRIGEGEDGRIICLDTKTGRHAPLSRCVTFQIKGQIEDGILVQINKKVCTLDPELGLKERLEKGGSEWSYDEFDEETERWEEEEAPRRKKRKVVKR